MAVTTKRFKKKKLFKLARELNIQTAHIEEFLSESGHSGALKGTGINAAVTTEEAYHALIVQFKGERATAMRVGKLREEQQLLKAEQEAAKEEAVATRAEEPPFTAIRVTPEDKQPGPTIEDIVPPAPDTASEAPADREPAPAEADDGQPMDAAKDAQDAPVAPAEQETEAAAKPPAPEQPAAKELAPIEDQPAAEVAPADTPATEVPKAEVEPPEAVQDEPVALPEDEEKPAPAPEAPADAPEATEGPAAAAPEAESEKAVAPEAAEQPDEGLESPPADGLIKAADRVHLKGTKVVGKLDLQAVEEAKPTPAAKTKRKRKRRSTTPVATAIPQQPSAKSGTARQRKRGKKGKTKVAAEAVEQTVQETLREAEASSARQRQRRRRARRQARAEERRHEQREKTEQDQKLRVTEFVSTGELARLMNINVTEVITALFNAGMMVSINQRLDADTISFIVDEFDFEVEFITEFGTDDVELEDDEPEELESRAAVVTVMGHVDHGKTSLLDYIRSASVATGESGGITQHIGAYKVRLDDGRIMTFLDTPGHEAFTAMRARGAKVTDVVILVVAADDAVMPQTIEAINHARAAEVSVIVAVNKIDLPDANPQRVMQQLSDHGILVEQYGGQVQCSFVSAKTGEGVEDLLEKVLLEADILELKGNPARSAQGIVIESRLDRGRGNVATVLVQNGTLRVGDPFVAGIHGGRVRAMFDESDQRIKQAKPSEPALVLGLPGLPTVGDQFLGFVDADEAKNVAQRRQQIWREQKMRQYKHVKLEDIGRRMALGDFSELNLVIKADVGGSVEALSDALHKLSTDEVAVNIIHSGVGAINESDVMLASASDAVIIGFQVRPTTGARAAGEREEIDIHTYSIIYDAIEDVRDALEGLLQPEETEQITGVVDVRELFKVPKVGVIAGCYVSEGRIRRNDTVRVLREGVIVYTGKVSSLRRFKEDVKDVVVGYECGVGIDRFNDLKVGDQFEAFEIVELKRTLAVV